MSFKVKDLSVSISLGDEGGSTCTTLTKPTGDTASCLGSIYWQNGAARQRNLATLRAQLRNAMTRA